MNLQRAYYLLAAFYSLFPLIGLMAIFSGGGTPFAGGSPRVGSARRDRAVGLRTQRWCL